MIRTTESLRYNYSEYLSQEELMKGIGTGSMFKGKLKMNRYNKYQGGVNVRLIDRTVVIEGIDDINRALEGDIVSLELYDSSQWVGKFQGLTEEV